jgi:hypothetical protein
VKPLPGNRGGFFATFDGNSSRMLRFVISALLSVLLIASSCHKGPTPEQHSLRSFIDSVSSEYNQPSGAIPENLDVLIKANTLSDSMNYTQGFFETSAIIFRIYLLEKRYQDAFKTLDDALKKPERRII